MGKEVALAHSSFLPEALPDSPRATGSKQSKDVQTMQVATMLVQAQDMVYDKSSGTIYARQGDSHYYDRMEPDDLQTLAWKTWFASYGSFLPRDIDGVLRTVSMIIPRRVERVSKRFIMVSEHAYWDRDTGMIVPTPSEPVFYRLFDTKYETKHIVQIPQFSDEDEKVFMQTYAQVLEELSRGLEVERFDPLKVWANGNHDVYMDLHRAHAYMFLKKPPMGAYILIGVARNGKSAYCGMTHSIMGGQNTSSVPLTEMGDWHLNMDLHGTLMNSPDEEEDKGLSSQALFKSIADHGTVKLKVMREQKPLEVNCDFMCFFPMNHTPKWEGSGATACMKRSLIIPFTADLSKKDLGNSNFAKETFTARFMAEYLGSVFAYANYYHRHPLVFSHTMQAEQQTLEEDEVNYKVYVEEFMRFFKGYTRLGLVYQDYQNWCGTKELKWAPRKVFKFYLDSKFPSSSQTTMRLNGIARKVHVIPATKSHRVFHEDLADMEVESLAILHEKGASLVEQLTTYWEIKHWKAVNGVS